MTKSAWGQPSTDKPEELHWSDGNNFRVLLGVIVFVNAIQVALEVDHGPDAEGYRIPEVIFFWTNQFFCTVYFLEFVVHFNIHRFRYFRDPWNLFDFFLVCCAVAMNWVLPMFSADSRVFKRFVILRVFRVARAVRVLRLFFFFKDLWLILQGFFRTIIVLFWVTQVLAILTAIFALTCRMLIIPEEDVDKRFSTIHDAAFSLFQLMTLDNWAGTLARPVMENGNALAGALFIAWIMITNHCVLNIVLGLVVLNQKEISEELHQEVSKKIREQQMGGILAIKRFFEASDKNGDGYLDYQELKAALEEPMLKNLFMQLGLTVTDPKNLMILLSEGASIDTPLSFERFESGCKQLIGETKREDMLRLYNSISAVGQTARKHKNRCKKLASDIGATEAQLAGLVEKLRVFSLKTIDPIITLRRDAYFGKSKT